VDTRPTANRNPSDSRCDDRPHEETTMPLSSTRFRHCASTACALLLPLVAASARAHDMFLVLDDHAVAAQARVTVSLYNGTFDKSENVISRDRMLDVSVVDGRGERTHPASDRWRETGDVTLLDLDTAAPGTYVVGVSTAARTIALTAEEFAEYLRHDGVLDVLAARERDGRAGEAARERYSKHVKTLLTVGGAGSGSWATRLGYPIEIVPLADPAAVAPGGSLELLVLHDGAPAGGPARLRELRRPPRPRRRRHPPRSGERAHRRQRQSDDPDLAPRPLVRPPHPHARSRRTRDRLRVELGDAHVPGWRRGERSDALSTAAPRAQRAAGTLDGNPGWKVSLDEWLAAARERSVKFLDFRGVNSASRSSWARSHRRSPRGSVRRTSVRSWPTSDESRSDGGSRSGGRLLCWPWWLCSFGGGLGRSRRRTRPRRAAAPSGQRTDCSPRCSRPASSLAAGAKAIDFADAESADAPRFVEDLRASSSAAIGQEGRTGPKSDSVARGKSFLCFG
jgi:hypothetical protein